MAENYYLSRKDNLLRSFDHACRWLIAPLVGRYNQEFSIAVEEKARKEYEILIPDIPYIGGSSNHWTSDLLESVQYLALIRALRSMDTPVTEIAEVIYDGMRIRLNQYPHLLLRLVGRMQFSSLFIHRLQRLAGETQRQIYPANFKAEIVMGNGIEFDWGIDFTECGICKFYQAHNAIEFLPYVCRLDYVTSEAFGLGLVRTKTLANGDEKCNPRLKRGRNTEWSAFKVE